MKVWSLLICLFGLALSCNIKLDITAANEIQLITVGTTRLTGAAIANYNKYKGIASLYLSGDHIAVQVSGWGNNNPAGLLAAITVLDNKKQYYSNTNWVCTTSAPKGWESRGFDDSKWPRAVSYGTNGVGPWGTIPGMSSKAAWIWPPGGNTQPMTAYCRYDNFCPPIVDPPSSQSVCEMNQAEASGNAPNVVIPTQNFLVLSVEPNPYKYWTTMMVNQMKSVISQRYKSFTITYQDLSSGSSLPANLDSFTQIWIYDLAYYGDETGTHITQYNRIAKWYNDRPGKHLIADGRILSESYSSGGYDGTKRYQLYENYMINLAVRGGGLMLGTDHDVFANGINRINDAIGLGRFTAVIYGTKCTGDPKSPLVSWPNKDTLLADGTLMDHTSTSISPYNAQPNGSILYTMCWHNAAINSPAIASTIRGGVGFRVTITNPPCDAWYPEGTAITFESTIKGGSPGARLSYSWSSSIGGEFGHEASVKWTPPIGRNLIQVTVIESSGIVDRYYIAITITYRSKNNECYVTSYNGAQVKELFPVYGTKTAIQYYGYSGNANTPAKIESTLDSSANFFLYMSSAGDLSLVNIMSKNKGTAKYSFDLTTTNVLPFGTDPKLTFIDNPGDKHTVWDPKTGSATSRYVYSGETKGWILEKLPTIQGSAYCIEIRFDQLDLFSLSTMAFWALPTENRNANPQYWAHDSNRANKLQICRKQCGCPTQDVRTALSGVFSSVGVAFGKNGTVDRYDDFLQCSYRIQPSPPGAGIGIHFDRWSTRPGDTLTIYTGPAKDNRVALSHKDNTRPTSLRVDAAVADMTWAPNKDGLANAGWTIRYVVIPGLTTLSDKKRAVPQFGFSAGDNIVYVNGVGFVNSPTLKVYMDGKPLVTKYISPTQVSGALPRQNYDQVGTFHQITVSNDGVFFSKSLDIQFVDKDCGSQKSCTGCAINPKCSFCNNLVNPSLSYCYPTATGQCNAAQQVVDHDCCSQCANLNGCSGNGKCTCDDKCTCNPGFWGPDCACKKCPVYNGTECGGKGDCNCDGTCTCKPGAWGNDCSCKNCPGNPTCSGHGSCNCDGTCKCDATWTHVLAANPICDCPTVCPENCNNHGTCKCGQCRCNWDAIGVLCEKFATCGDGKIEYNERCDDGNNVGGDGCSAFCLREIGYNCDIPGKPCYPICGDGLTVKEEACDDGNQREGDGCDHTCKVEDGWICYPGSIGDAVGYPHSLCCDIMDEALRSYPSSQSIPPQLVCYGGWWRVGNKTNIADVAFNTLTVEGTEEQLIVKNHLHLCGDLVIAVPWVIDATIIYVAGTVTVVEGGRIILRRNGQLIISDHCDGELWTKQDQLVIESEGGVQIDLLDWKEPYEIPNLPISVERCANVDGTLYLTPSNIPRDENRMYLIDSLSNCVHAGNNDAPFPKQSVDLPGGCSNAYNYIDSVDDSVVIHFNYKHMCGGSIAGVVVGATIAVGAVAAVGVVAMSGGASSAGSAAGAYTNL